MLVRRGCTGLAPRLELDNHCSRRRGSEGDDEVGAVQSRDARSDVDRGVGVDRRGGVLGSGEQSAGRASAQGRLVHDVDGGDRGGGREDGQLGEEALVGGYRWLDPGQRVGGAHPARCPTHGSRRDRQRARGVDAHDVSPVGRARRGGRDCPTGVGVDRPVDGVGTGRDGDGQTGVGGDPHAGDDIGAVLAR